MFRFPLRRSLAALPLAAFAASAPPIPLDWWEQQKILAPDGEGGDEFGTSVAIDGDTLLIGCRRDDQVAADAGSAYVFVRSGVSWSFQQRLEAGDGASFDLFGTSVALDGDTAVIGALEDDDGGFASGSAYVFVRSAGAWTQQQKLTAGDAAANDYFGSSVSISGHTVVVGADGQGGSGAAYVFTRSGTTWTEEQKIKAVDAASGDAFGISVAVSGDTAAIGAQGDDDLGSWSGSTYVYLRNAGVWTPQQKLTASDGAGGDWFGFATALDGDTLAVGANGEDGAGTNRGAAYVFRRSGALWTEEGKLVSDNPDNGDFFGYSVGVSGDHVAVGAYYDQQPLKSNTGGAYVFERNGSAWSLDEALWASDGSNGDYFGYSVGISGKALVVGALFDYQATPGSTTGSAYVFAACPTVPSAEVSRAGTPPNPGALLGGQSSGPVIGATWDPVIDHTSFHPTATLDVLILTALPLNIYLGPPLGTLLCDVITPSPLYFFSPAGVPFSLALPQNCKLVGKSVTVQGLSSDGILPVLTNALDATIGSL